MTARDAVRAVARRLVGGGVGFTCVDRLPSSRSNAVA